MRESGERRPGIIRIAVSGLLAMGLALGLLISSQPAAEAKTSYVPTSFQRAHYGQQNSRVVNIQLRLAAADMMQKRYVTGYYGDITKGAVKAFRTAHGMKPTSGKKMTRRTWRALVKATGQVVRSRTSDVKIAGIDDRCLTGHRVLCIDKTRRKLYYLNHNRVIRTLDARFGCLNSPTREGAFTVFRKVRHDWSRLYGSAMPLSMYFSGGEAVHYSSDFAARGYAGCSHGCVNIRERKNLRFVYKRIHIGDQVVVYWS
ncbi:MAG: murein L,D-transpeptidase [Microlunatus sp.]|nr:murein L,D-transpeptidase [Microlunatus sp.]